MFKKIIKYKPPVSISPYTRRESLNFTKENLTVEEDTATFEKRIGLFSRRWVTNDSGLIC